jgi:peptidoglycan/LPS O-acetylase OafA/YrhL
VVNHAVIVALAQHPYRVRGRALLKGNGHHRGTNRSRWPSGDRVGSSSRGHPVLIRDDTAKKLVGLECLRFTTAFAIVVWHYHQFLYVGDTVSGFVMERQPFFAVLAPFYLDGYWGVQLFWCISGFIFAWKYQTIIGSGLISFARFAMLRFSRLYPLHLVTLLVVAVLQEIYVRQQGAWFKSQYNDLWHFLLNLAYAQYWGLQQGFSFNAPSWSVSAEILVYGLFFITCRLSGERRIAGVAVAVGTFLAAAVAQAWFGRGSNVLLVVSFFYLGVLACHLYRWIIALPTGARRIAYAIVAGIAVGTPVLIACGGLTVEGTSLFLFPGVVLFFQFAIPDHHPILNRALTVLGDLTYSSYLVQFPLQLSIVLIAAWAGVRLNEWFFSDGLFLFYVLSVFCVARVVFLRFERPAQSALRRSFAAMPWNAAVAGS